LKLSEGENVEPNPELMQTLNGIMRARSDYMKKDWDVEAWEKTYEMLQQIFDKPENLLTLVTRWLQTMRNDVAKKAAKYPELSGYYDVNTGAIDDKAKLVAECIQYVSAVREHQR
jgi:hypothetical protein